MHGTVLTLPIIPCLLFTDLWDRYCLYPTLQMWSWRPVGRLNCSPVVRQQVNDRPPVHQAHALPQCALSQDRGGGSRSRRGYGQERSSFHASFPWWFLKALRFNGKNTDLKEVPVLSFCSTCAFLNKSLHLWVCWVGLSLQAIVWWC